ncbi:metalloprotease [Fusarium albosuccineum]|uniref:Metalloprotease n=1 Tax=Fusarium albosuccineum TaxID=1237068 RepID=A0A8H4LQB6_9HYPO|nr:metalloprotease [Fusarium albosuccineum]
MALWHKNSSPPKVQPPVLTNIDINSHPREGGIPCEGATQLLVQFVAISVEANEKSVMAPAAEGLWAELEDLWPKAHTITVAFLGPSCDHPKFNVKDMVKECAECWTQGANISCEFLDEGADCKARDTADVRIVFRPEETSWSLVGNKAGDKGKPTMNLAITPGLSEEIVRRKTLHELGHALGFRHEHASPNSELEFDESTRARCAKDTGMTEEWLKKNLGKKDSKRPRLVSEFDKESIMIYQLHPRWNVGRMAIRRTTQLSKMDKEMVKIAYPFEDGGVASTQTSINLSQPGDNRTLDSGSWGCDYEACKPAGRQCDACYRYGKRVLRQDRADRDDLNDWLSAIKL